MLFTQMEASSKSGFEFEQENRMLIAFAQLTQGHIQKSEGKLGLLPLDAETYPAQRAFHIEGLSKPAGVIDSVAAVAEPRFQGMLEAAADTEQSRTALEKAAIFWTAAAMS